MEISRVNQDRTFQLNQPRGTGLKNLNPLSVLAQKSESESEFHHAVQNLTGKSPDPEWLNTSLSNM